MYFQDLTSYSYHHLGVFENTVNIGWLDSAQPYQFGQLLDEFRDKLWSFLQFKLVRLRGFHICNLCSDQASTILTVSKGDEILKLGDAEIRVLGMDGKIYAAPNLIYHYVTVHEYKPPDEFVQAVLKGASTDSDVYQKFLAQFGKKKI